MRMGKITASCNISLASSNSAIYSNVISGFLSIISLSNISIKSLSGPLPSGYTLYK